MKANKSVCAILCTGRATTGGNHLTSCYAMFWKETLHSPFSRCIRKQRARDRKNFFIMFVSWIRQRPDGGKKVHCAFRNNISEWKRICQVQKNQLARRCSLGVLESQNHNIKKKSGMNSLFLSSVPFYFIYFILFLTPFALSFCSSF